MNATEETLYTLAHPRSAPVTYCTALQLPAAGALTDPNAVGTPPIPVPSWALNAMFFVAYANGAGGTGAGSTSVTMYAGPIAGSVLVPYGSFGIGIVQAPGGASVATIAGVTSIGFQFGESGDVAHPGKVTVTVVFTR